MKNLIQSITLLLGVYFTQTINAQSWVYDGNSSAGEYIGTNSNQPFPIYTNGFERMRVDANGNVGIGTNNPLNLLDLNSSTASGVFQRFSNSVTGNSSTNDGFSVGIDNNGNALLANKFPLYDITMLTGPTRGLTIKGSNNGISGYVGIGDLTYFNPQSLLHLCRDASEVYTQFTSTPTDYGANDGLKIGVFSTFNFLSGYSDPIAEVRNQENTALMLLSNNGERLRLTQTGALNNGITFNPGSLADNLTRIGISHNPSTPITRPLSLLHLGYNVANATTNDGWRPWMDVGMFTSQNSDHVYLGMQDQEDGSGTGSDAVLAWGDNSYPDGSGPDNLKIVFTSPYNASTPGLYASRVNGLEALRMSPTPLGQSINTGIGGDPTVNQYYGSSANPTATLEVNAWGATSATGGSSGLRFTNLNNSSPPMTNPGPGVLAVDAEGDVIYVNPSNVPQIGNYQPDPQNPITNNYEIPLNNHNYYFSGQSTNPDSNNIGSSVGIGLPCGDPIPLAKLHVLQSETNPAMDSTSLAGYFVSEAPGKAAGAVKCIALGEAEKLYGGIFEAEGQSINPRQWAVGVWADAANALEVNAGVVGIASNGDDNYGVYGRAEVGTHNYAIFGEVDTNAASSWAGYFVGDVLTTRAQYFTSDIKFKNNIKNLGSTNALSFIDKITPKTYEYKSSDFPSMNLPNGKQIGLIAQEVEAVFPELVKNVVHPAKWDKQGKIIHPAVPFKAVNYIGFIPVLIGAVKEQQHTIDSLKEVINERLASLENRLNGCCGTPQHYKTDPNEQNTKNAQDIALSNPQTIILDQNTPNPFAEKTVIGYALPVDVQVAEIIFHNAEGKQINRTTINTRGNGEINVYAQDLSSGIYTYTLIVDGKIIDTKRMVKK